jgi:exodeoxyribonuclease VII large subunit
MSCIRVSELNELAREALNSCFGDEVWVVGEIHGLKVHSKSGHIYFDLVEKASISSDQYIAKVSCAFFRGSFLTWRKSLASSGFGRFDLVSGIEVKVKAKVDLFGREGRYQLLVSEVDPTYTFGTIARQRTQTIEYLKSKGLLEKNKRLPLVAPVLNIGLITSRGSAAYKDFTSIILGSPYAFRVTLFDAHMQGEGAIPEITRGIRALERDPGVDVIVIIRGGGAKTDLFVYDDLGLCRTVALCSKPVMTGIGHEIDLSVADMTAHTCFVTPTDAARFLVGEADAVWDFLEGAAEQVVNTSRNLLEKSSHQLGMLATKLAFLTQRQTIHAHSVLRNASSFLHRKCTGELVSREKQLMKVLSELAHRANAGIQAHESFLERTGLALRLNSLARIRDMRRDLETRHSLMLEGSASRISRDLTALERLDRELALLRPEETLRRGYSITLNGSGKALLDPVAVTTDERIVSILFKGKVFSIVYGKEPG